MTPTKVFLLIIILYLLKFFGFKKSIIRLLNYQRVDKVRSPAFHMFNRMEDIHSIFLPHFLS